MELKDIIYDSLAFPLNNIKSLALYLVLGFVLALILILTGLGTIVGLSNDSGVGLIIALIGFIIFLFIMFAIEGYVLDILKSGINRSSTGPSIDFVRQAVAGVKLLIVNFVYFIIPIIILLVLSLIFPDWIIILIALVLFIIFGLIASMGNCRLAKTEDIGYALNINEAIEDIKTIGVVNVVLTIVAVAVISAVISIIVSAVFGLISQDLATIVEFIVSIYLLFFSNRAYGLLYSNI